MRTLSTASRRYLAASVALAVVAGFGVHSYLAGARRAQAGSGEEVSVVVASRDLGRGSTVGPRDFHLASVPARYAQPGALNSIRQAAGRVALTALSTGETVTDNRLARVRAGPVASLVPEGLRAFAVPTSLPRGSLVPGDHVDVLATYAQGQPHTETVASDVDVLLVLGSSGSPGGGTSGEHGTGLDVGGASGANALTLILLVAPEQEEHLAYARAFANLEVVIAPATA